GIQSNAALEDDETPEAVDSAETPPFIQELIAIEKTLASIGRLIRSRQNVHYSTQSEAFEAARRLAQGDITNLLSGIENLSDHRYSVSGPTVLMPNNTETHGATIDGKVHPK